MEKKQCFIPLNQLCTPSCMAYRSGDRKPECVLLKLVDTIRYGIMDASRPPKKTVHPKSAPPPEVRT